MKNEMLFGKNFEEISNIISIMDEYDLANDSDLAGALGDETPALEWKHRAERAELKLRKIEKEAKL